MTAPRAANPEELSALLPALDEAALARACGELDERPIEYALGTGEADQVALFAGLKPVLRQLLDASAIDRVRERFAALGLALEETAHVESSAGPAPGRVLFVGRDPARVREAARLEGRPDHDLELGRLLGYPRCCIEAYLAVPPPRSNAQVFARAAARTRDAHAAWHPRLNVLDQSVFHYVSWLPCSYGCAPSRAYAHAVARHIAFSHGQFVGTGRAAIEARSVCPPGCRHQRFVAAIDRALFAHRLLLFEDVQLSLTGRFDGDTLGIERAWPTARDRHPDIRPRPAARDAVARLLAAVRAAGRVAVRDGELLLGDHAVARTDDALLAPFGAA